MILSGMFQSKKDASLGKKSSDRQKEHQNIQGAQGQGEIALNRYRISSFGNMVKSVIGGGGGSSSNDKIKHNSKDKRPQDEEEKKRESDKESRTLR
jgi:hypothetical protein